MRGNHLLDRIGPFERWRRTHSEKGQWGYHQEMLTAPSLRRPTLRDEYAREASGVNLLSQDYLTLSTHPEVRRAIVETLETYGPHSGGSPVVAGETSLSAQLRDELAGLTGMKDVVLFPTGWAAGFGAVNALVRRSDHVVVDELTHACMQEAIAASRSPNVTRFPHLDNESVRSTLRRIRSGDSKNGILVITESLFSLNSDTPDLADLQRICHDHDAVLLVDSAHDIGVMGPNGHGVAAQQGMRGQLDLVVGSFSKVFATNGGYLAANSDTVTQYVRYFGSTHMFSSALTPLQTAAALAAARVITSEEGGRRRAAVMRNAEILRKELGKATGSTLLGQPSPIVPLAVDSLAVGREAMAIAQSNGVLLHLLEFPIVPRRQARYRLQLTSSHEPAELVEAASILAEAIATAWQRHGAAENPVVSTT
ncbi:8-amino-7-oxononanoate synthase [Amycolatopsis alba DSM 44262]|uniref:8-amino-7-oxononanoate synthase n=2 Tax=Amycolatopsis alba TaxID=76020 RepID=A0A229RSV5_AMYAL|nr:8-amino-7-oxononanoate synthase [Amycolatopsis alba DSM 44262]